MVWYWDVVIGVGAFDVAVVLAALLVSVIRDRTQGSELAERKEAYLSQECVLHFLQMLHLAGHQKEM